MALQNFVNQVGPPIGASWLNGVDVAINQTLGGGATPSAVLQALGLEAPFTVEKGGTGATTANQALANLGGTTLTAINQAFIGEQLYPQTTTEQAADVTPINYFDPPIPFTDVRRYGCKCDGTTDDTTAFQNALTITATLGLALVIPYGFAMKITAYCQLPSNTSLHILGTISTTARQSGLFCNGASNVGVYGYKTGLIQDSSVLAGYTWNPGAGYIAPSIHIRSSNHVTIDGVNFSYVSTGVYITNAAQNYVNNAAFNPSQAAPVDVKVRDCSMQFCEWSGIACLGGYQIAYHHNYVYRCGDSGLWMMGGINSEVVNNHRVSPKTVYADVLTYGQNVQAHPTTWNDVQGMSFQNCQNLLISGNEVQYIQGEAIDIKDGCNRVLCIGNRVSNTEQYSITVREGDSGNTNACYKVTIQNNIISNHGYVMFSNSPSGLASAISVSSDFQTVIDGNTIFSYALTPGITCSGPGAYMSGGYAGNQQQAHISVTNNVFDFMAVNAYDTSEFQFTSATLGAILIDGAYTSVKCDGNDIRTDRYYYTDNRLNSHAAIQLSYINTGAGLYYPTSASVSGNKVVGWGNTGIYVAGLGAMIDSGLVCCNNNVAGAGGYGLNIALTNYAVVNNNNVSQLNNNATNTYCGINLAGSVANPLVGVVCSGNSITAGWNIGGNQMAYNIQMSYCAEINLTNNRMAGAVSGTLAQTNWTGSIILTGSSGFPRSNAGSPNGVVISYFQGEMLFDSTNLKWWAASTYQSTVWTQLSN